MLGKVVVAFTDKLNQSVVHKLNGVFYTTDKARFDEVTSEKNAIGKVLVKPMTVAELSELAKEHNIEVPAKIKRDDLEALIEGELYGTDAE
ncbi:hypothetical protein [Macrococcoides bohemicum]|uniref:hypothetical protein n=1 Tax=Macrococcoides bohemicum TaxID=1903056 RepID=UPI002897DF83|nr:hypothetical protein [Macrococcus bohemicus]